MKELTKRQEQVLLFIDNYIKKHSYPPAIREVAENFSISVKGAHDHITALKKKGHLKQADKRPRTMGLTKPKLDDDSEIMKIPLLGKVAAGIPILAEENFEGSILLHRSMFKKNKRYFALKVEGDSMSGAGIYENDTAIFEEAVVAKNGEIVIAGVGEEKVTLKRFFKESSRVRLQPENPEHTPIYSQDVRIAGRLYTIIRSY